jgi:hypothetical protein
VTGIPASWDSCTAILGTTTEVRHAVWSLCGQFVAVSFANGAGIRDSTTLGKVSDLRPPSSLEKFTPKSLAFSPNGRLLACTFDPVREPNLSVSHPHISAHTYLRAQIEYICIPVSSFGTSDRYCRQGYSHMGYRRDRVLWKPNPHLLSSPNPASPHSMESAENMYARVNVYYHSITNWVRIGPTMNLCGSP